MKFCMESIGSRHAPQKIPGHSPQTVLMKNKPPKFPPEQSPQTLSPEKSPKKNPQGHFSHEKASPNAS